MKNYYYLTSWLLFTMLFLTSCGKENSLNEKSLTHNGIVFTEAKLSNNFDLGVDVTVEDGMLSFQVDTDFHQALDAISGDGSVYHTPEAMEQWQEKLGFNSMGVQYQKIRTAFEVVDSDESLAQFKSNFPDVLYNQDPTVDEIEMPVRNEILAYLLNEDGKLLINDQLYVYTNDYQIVILDKNEAKLQEALKTLETNEEEGIYVFKSTIELSESEASASVRNGPCGVEGESQQQGQNGDPTEDNDKKVIGTVRIDVQLTNVSQSGGVQWRVIFKHYYNGRSKRRNWRGQWRSYSADIYYHNTYNICSNVSTSNYTGSYTFDPPGNTSSHTWLSPTLYSRTYPAGASVTAEMSYFSYWIWVDNFNGGNNENIRLDYKCNL